MHDLVGLLDVWGLVVQCTDLICLSGLVMEARDEEMISRVFIYLCLRHLEYSQESTCRSSCEQCSKRTILLFTISVGVHSDPSRVDVAASGGTGGFQLILVLYTEVAECQLVWRISV